MKERVAGQFLCEIRLRLLCTLGPNFNGCYVLVLANRRFALGNPRRGVLRASGTRPGPTERKRRPHWKKSHWDFFHPSCALLTLLGPWGVAPNPTSLFEKGWTENFWAAVRRPINAGGEAGSYGAVLRRKPQCADRPAGVTEQFFGGFIAALFATGGDWFVGGKGVENARPATEKFFACFLSRKQDGTP